VLIKYSYLETGLADVVEVVKEISRIETLELFLSKVLALKSQVYNELELLSKTQRFGLCQLVELKYKDIVYNFQKKSFENQLYP